MRHPESLTACSGEMLMSDNSVRPCAVKTVEYATDLQRHWARLELAALKTALGVPNIVQCLGCWRSKGPDAPMLHIVTEWVFFSCSFCSAQWEALSTRCLS